MKHSPIFPDSRERYFGWRYLLFQVIFLSQLLQVVLALLGVQLPAATVNFVYFSINATVAVVGFRGFWRQTLSAAVTCIPRILICAAGGFLAYRVLTIAMAVVIFVIDPDFANVNDGSIISMAQEHFWLMVIGTVILAPLAEETFNRGAVFGALYRRSRVAAYAVSAIVFSLIHINGYLGYVPGPTLLLCFLQYLPAGVCLAAAYEISGSIITPILIHSVINAIAIFATR